MGTEDFFLFGQGLSSTAPVHVNSLTIGIPPFLSDVFFSGNVDGFTEILLLAALLKYQNNQ